MTWLAELLGESPGIQAVRDTVRRLLAHGTEGRRLPPILIQGETGTGKGLLARAIHRAGPRRAGPLVEVNCAAIPETLLEAELFGFERGAFTDARHAKPGLFQTAHGGTLFLDEVGLLPEGVQAKFLKVLEDHAVRRLGSTRTEPADVAIVAATSEELLDAVQARRFREDLFHRLTVVTVRLPSLADRGSDTLLLAEHFLGRACTDYGLRRKALTEDAQAALLAYGWPGNIRELANVMERVALLTDAPLVTAAALGLPATPAMETSGPTERRPSPPLREALGTVERTHLIDALSDTNWNIARAAARLRIPRGTLRYRIEKLGLRPGLSPGRQDPVGGPPLGEPASESPRRAPPRRGALLWERRRLAFLRITLVFPPDRDIGPDVASRALEVFVDKVESFGGRVEELGPAGVVAAFGLEPAEDAAQRAAHAAIAARKAAERAQHGAGETLATKIGIHVGQVLVGQAGEATVVDVEGKREAYAMLEKLLAAAERDAILVSAAAVPTLERRFGLTPLGPIDATAELVYRLEGLERSGLGPQGRLTPFLGRDQELALLRARLHAARSGQGQVIGIAGDPGIGKSRLVFEFRRSLAGEPVTLLEGRCPSYGSGSPYLPVGEMLRQDCQVTDADPPDAVTAKVRQRLDAIGLGADEVLPYLLRLLGVEPGTEGLASLNPDAIRLDTFEHLRRLTLTLSRTQPLVLVVEDLHWIDTASEAYLASLAEIVPAAAVLLVVTYRSGYQPPWIGRSYATQVALQPLLPTDSLAVVRSIWPAGEPPEAVAQRLLAAAEGNPFFLEELSRSAPEPGDTPSALGVPDTVQDVILARMDRLPADARRHLQVASVIGRRVPSRLLRAIIEEPALEASVAELTRLEFLREQGGLEGPIHVFKHALTRDVAYDSLAPGRRRDLHRRFGLAIEQLHADRLAEQVEILAHHFSNAEEWGKAFEYLRKAAERAAGAFATREAIDFYDRALAAAARLERGPEARTLMAICQARADLHSILSDFGRARADRARVLLLAREVGDRVAEGTALAAMGMASVWAHDFDQAVADAHAAIQAAEEVGAKAVLAAGYAVTSTVHEVTGRLDEAWADAERAVRLSRSVGDVANEALSVSILGEIRNFQGQYGEAVRLQSEALQIARAHRLIEPLLWIFFSYGVASTGQGNYDDALTIFEEGLALSAKVGDEIWRHRLLNSLGWLYGEVGDLDRALALNRQGAEEARTRGDPETIANAELNLGDLLVAEGDVVQAGELLDGVHRLVKNPSTSDWMKWRYSMHLFASLGDLCLARADPRRAREFANQCLELATRTNSRKYLVRGWRLTGEIALAHRQWAEAEEALRRALTIARALGNPTQLWKSNVGLGRLFAEVKRPREAHEAYRAAGAVIEHLRANLTHPALRASLESAPPIRRVFELASPD